MRFIKGLVLALLGIVTALGLAGPGHAQGPAAKAPGTPEGVYDVNIDGQAQTTWEIFPICVPTVGDLREPLLLPVACTLKVGPSNMAGREARMVDGQWQFVYNDSRAHLSRRQHSPSTDDLPIRRVFIDRPDEGSARRRVRRRTRDGRCAAHHEVQPAAGDSRQPVPAAVRAGRPAPLLLSCLASPRSAGKPAAV